MRGRGAACVRCLLAGCPVYRTCQRGRGLPMPRGMSHSGRRVCWAGPRRDLIRQSPKNNGETRGTFSLRSPVRPNPIGTSLAILVGIDKATVLVRGLDCLNGTPLLDLKPDRCSFTPLSTLPTAAAR